jgi:hypothetical protein
MPRSTIISKRQTPIPKEVCDAFDVFQQLNRRALDTEIPKPLALHPVTPEVTGSSRHQR